MPHLCFYSWKFQFPCVKLWPLSCAGHEARQCSSPASWCGGGGWCSHQVAGPPPWRSSKVGLLIAILLFSLFHVFSFTFTFLSVAPCTLLSCPWSVCCPRTSPSLCWWPCSSWNMSCVSFLCFTFFSEVVLSKNLNDQLSIYIEKENFLQAIHTRRL